MSAVVGSASSPSQNAGIILSSNLKKEAEKKNDKISADFCKDLIKEMKKKSDDIEEKNDEQIIKKDDHKGDESSSKQNQLLIRNIGLSAEEKKLKPEVKILRLNIYSPDRADVVLPIPFPSTTSKDTLFTLKEGSKYRITFHFSVSQNIVKNFSSVYSVWKAGVRVRQTTKLIGTFSPQEEEYIHESDKGVTPSGFFARGSFFIRWKFVDDDGNCYLDTNYYFDIRKDWGAREKC
ncbi:unnamed protein product [Amaranthus hypochondriacus]